MMSEDAANGHEARKGRKAAARTADISLLLITLLWGFSFVIVKGVLAYVDAYWFLFLRFGVAGLASLFFFPGVWRRINRRAIKDGAVLALVLYGGFVFQTLGLKFTTPAKSAFITGVSVILVPVFGLLVFRIGLSREVVFGIATAFIGLYLLTNPGDLAHMNKGDILTFGCAVVFAFHILLVSRFVKRSDAGALAVLQLLWSTLLAVPLAFFLDGARFDYSWTFYVALAYLAIFCSALAFSVQLRAQRTVPASRAALIFALEPVSAAAASVILYGERLLWREWLGGALVVLGVLWGEVSVLRSKYGTGGDEQRINQCQNELG